MVFLTYINIVVQFHTPRAVEFYLFQSLSHDIVGLALGSLSGLDHGRLVYVTLVVDVKLAERVLQLEDLVLLELRVLSVKCEWLVGGVDM